MIVGLGNPSIGYKNTRHNLGFDIVDKFCEKNCVKISNKKFYSIYAKSKFNKKTIIVVEPQTFMNNSGIAVNKFARYYNIIINHIIVVHDDITLPVGQIKIKQGGSSGGHNGVKSIIDFLDSENFIRLKCGIGTKPKNAKLSDWVLQKFNEEEQELTTKAAINAVKFIEFIIKDGVEAAMNECNTKIKN